MFKSELEMTHEATCEFDVIIFCSEINCKEVMQENKNNFKILLAHISKQTLIKSKKRLSHQQQPIRFNF